MLKKYGKMLKNREIPIEL